MVDDDVAAHPDLLGIAGHGLDIVGAPCLIARQEVLVPFPNVFDFREGAFVPAKHAFRPERGLVEVDGIGTGTICLSRKVLEHPALRVPFQHGFDQDGVIVITEDLVFCRRVRELGFKIWADYDRMSDQWVKVSLLGLQERYSQAMEIYRQRMNASQGIGQVTAPPERRTNGGIILP